MRSPGSLTGGGALAHSNPMPAYDIAYSPLNDYYEVLAVEPQATQEEIVCAYRAAVKKHHPDAGGDPTCGKIRAVYEAYSVLGHPFKRAVYNGSRNRHGPPPAWQGGEPVRRPRRTRVRRAAAAAAMMVCITAGVVLLAAAVAGVGEGETRGARRTQDEFGEISSGLQQAPLGEKPQGRRQAAPSVSPGGLFPARPERSMGVMFEYATPLEPDSSEQASR